MKILIICVVLVVVFAIPVNAELTESDLRKIKEIVASEVAILKNDITQVELRLNEKIRESENRLQTQFSTALDNRTNGIMILFAVISIGFFLLFSAILLVGAFNRRNREINKKPIVTMLILSLGCAVFYAHKLHAQEVFDARFGEIICTRLTVVDDEGNNGVVLDSSPESNMIIVGDKTSRRPAIALASAKLPGFALENRILIHDSRGNYAIDLHALSSQNHVTVYDKITKQESISLRSGEGTNSFLLYEAGKHISQLASVISSTKDWGNMIAVHNGVGGIKLGAYDNLPISIQIIDRNDKLKWYAAEE